jgi:hypothetical protein
MVNKVQCEPQPFPLLRFTQCNPASGINVS